ncbi:MAG: AraC family transcriptional regulator [Thermoguttaceae bacterium]|jgi:AraC-like DNA-binding protein
MDQLPDIPVQPHKEPDFFSLQVREAQRFYLDLAPPPTEPIAVVCGGYEQCAADYAIHRMNFPYYTIEFVARGKGSVTLDGQDYPLTVGTVFTYGPGVPHDFSTFADDPLGKYFISCTGSQALDLLQQHSLAPGHIGRVYAPAEIQDVFDELIRNGLRHTYFSPSLCVKLLEYLILKIAESLMPWHGVETPAFATYQRCHRYIWANHPRLRSMAEVSRECRVDPAYLCRLFRRYAHQSPYQFLMRLKMNLAAERLQNPELLVKQAAVQLGFNDPFHFSRAFKKVFGLSPEEFRRLH